LAGCKKIQSSVWPSLLTDSSVAKISFVRAVATFGWNFHQWDTKIQIFMVIFGNIIWSNLTSVD